MLSIENISFSYPINKKEHRTIIQDCSLTLDTGQWLSILGPSGCGKSTLLKLIAGLLSPSKGSISFHNSPIDPKNWKKGEIGFLFQSVGLIDHLSSIRNLELMLTAGPRKLSQKQAIDEIHQLAEKLNLEHFLNREVSHLSGGERQRLGLARVLLAKPKLLLLDEPLTYLDVENRDRILDYLLEFKRTTQTTAVQVTHDVDEACILGDFLSTLQNGNLSSKAAPRELWDSPTDLRSAQSLGSPSFNTIPISSLPSGLVDQLTHSHERAASEMMCFHPSSVEVPGFKESDSLGLSEWMFECESVTHYQFWGHTVIKAKCLNLLSTETIQISVPWTKEMPPKHFHANVPINTISFIATP